MQPYNYSIDVASPFESAVQGLKFGAGLADMQMERQAQAVKLQQQQQAMQQQQALSATLRGLGEKIKSGTATSSDFHQVSLMAPKEQSEAALKTWESMNQTKKENLLSFSSQVMSALGSKEPQIGIDLLKQRAEAERNTGNEDQAKAYDTWAKLAELDPVNSQVAVGGMLSGLPGGDKVVDSWVKAQAERRAAELQPAALKKAEAEATTAEVGAQFAAPKALADLEAAKWNVKNLQNQINVRGAQLGLDRQRLATDTQLKLAELGQKAAELPAGAQKLVNDAAVTAAAAKQQAGSMNDLSSRIMQIGTSWGAAGSAAEWLKKAGGMQGGISELRQEYTRLRNSAAVGSLPPGPATDKDIAMVLEGFPPSTASPEVLSRFLRGMAKLKDVEAGVEGAKVDWLASNRGALTRAGNSFIAGDYSVKAGETFTDFAGRVAKDVAKKYTGQGPSLVDQIPGQSKPAAAAPQNRIFQEADAILRGGK